MAWKLTQKMKQWHVLLLALWVLLWLTVQLWPGSFWLEIRQVRVFSAAVGEPVRMAVDQTIHRNFYGQQSVRVRKLENDGWLMACSSNTGGQYVTTDMLPADLDLGWWTDGRCQALPVGQYLVNTSWRIEGGLLPDKIVSVDSNIFEVRAQAED